MRSCKIQGLILTKYVTLRYILYDYKCIQRNVSFFQKLNNKNHKWPSCSYSTLRNPSDSTGKFAKLCSFGIPSWITSSNITYFTRWEILQNYASLTKVDNCKIKVPGRFWTDCQDLSGHEIFLWFLLVHRLKVGVARQLFHRYIYMQHHHRHMYAILDWP